MGKTTKNINIKKQPQCYLIYGENEVDINNERMNLVNSLLTQEERLQNLTEMEPPQGRLLSLSNIGSDLMAELSTLSLFPESKRVVVVYNLENFFKSEKKTQASKEIDEFFSKFLQKELPATNNIVVFINFENYEKKRTIDKKSVLFETISSIGIIKEFKEQPILWQMEPLILQRNVPGCIELFRAWLKKDLNAPRKLFNLFVKIINLLIQIKIKDDMPSDLTKNFDLETSLFPTKMPQNIKTLNPYVLKRYMTSSHLFSLEKLIWANKQLLNLNKIVFPQSSDIYVPDVNTSIELFILKFLSTEKGDL